MAYNGGEDAFLAGLGNGSNAQPATAAPGNEDDDEDDYDPASFAPNSAEISQSATPQITTIIQPPTPQASDPNPAVQQGSRPTSTAPSRTASRLSQKSGSKPATIAGFIDEDSDEDEEEQTEQVANIEDSNGHVASVKSPSQAQPTPGSVPPTPLPSNAQMYSTPQPQATGVSEAPSNGTGVAEPVSNPPVPVPSFDGATEGKTGEAASSSIVQAAVPQSDASLSQSVPKSRLPQDVVGQFEDRIADDPKGDVDAWLGLIAHLRSRQKIDDVRRVYGRFFEVFPSAADQWVAYAQMELELDDLPKLEGIFQQALLKVQSIPLWSMYLDHVRRRNDIATDASGQGRQTVSQAYEFVLTQAGHDKDSGRIWHDYIGFVKSGPGTAGGTGWQDAQKMDLLRKAYQRAICAPMEAVSALWKEYDQFEMGLNKMTGRKFLQEKSPSYITARSSYTALQNLTIGLKRGGVPRLPPHPGFDGDDEIQDQIDKWQKWIAWEKEDPLAFKDEDVSAFHQRILYAYRHATLALRFWPPIWFDAAEWCFNNGLDTEGTDFLDQGAGANHESSLLAFRQADRIEQTTPAGEGEQGLKRKGDAVRQPYDVNLNALYTLIDKVKSREKGVIARLEEEFAAMPAESREASAEVDGEESDDENKASKPLSRQAQKEKLIEDIHASSKTQVKLISRTLTFVWIALMRTFRRMQGKGKPGDTVGGMRQIFADARKKGKLLSDLYAASALMEYHCYHDPAAAKIFERGTKLFPDDENFAMEYIKHLISTGDVTNARSVFETTVAKITSKPGNNERAKPLYLFFHDWESKFGEMAQITKIETRMAELYPEDPRLQLFGQRFASINVNLPVFDPCAVTLVLSPTQVKPKLAQVEAVQSVETLQPIAATIPGYVQSPKRPLDESDAEQPARKLLRGESPLKGAAGRRQQQRQAREGLASAPTPAVQPMSLPIPKPLPPSVLMLLSIIPPARQWQETRFDPQRMVELLRNVDTGAARLPGQAGGNYGYQYGR